MKKLLNIFIIGLQIGLTFVVTVCIYMFAAIWESEWGLDGIVELGFQVIWAVIISILTIICCGILGLPIRLVKVLNQWWTRHFYIAILMTVFGLLLIVISMTPQYIEQTTEWLDGQKTTRETPNGVLLISGWFLTAFSILHTYPPNRLKRILLNLTKKKT